MARIVLLTHGTGGDVLPFVAIGRALRARGHGVVLCTHQPYAQTAARSGLEFVPIDTEESYRRHLEQTPELLAAAGPAAIRDFYRRGRLIEQTRREITALIAHHRPGETVLVGRHTSAVAALIVAEARAIPCAWLAVSPTQLQTAPAALLNLGIGLGDELNELRAEVGLAPITRWSTWFDTPDALLGSWPRWFDRAGAPAPGHVRLTGFASCDPAFADAELPADVASLLAGDERPILITGGTGRMMHERFYQVATEAAALLGRAALVVTPHRGMLPSQLPPRQWWYPALPFAAVLARGAVALHHGGIGTAATAIAVGAPQVILAHGADRPDNAARLARCGLARWLPGDAWQPDRVAALLDEVTLAPRPTTPDSRPAGAGPGGDTVVTAGTAEGADVAASMIEQLVGGSRTSAATRRMRERMRSLPAGQRERLMALLGAEALARSSSTQPSSRGSLRG